MADQTSSFSASRRRAWASSRSPAGASASLRPWRSNRRQSSASSSRLICWLAAAWLTPSAEAARGDAVGVDDRQEGADQGDVEVSAHEGIYMNDYIQNIRFYYS